MPVETADQCFTAGVRTWLQDVIIDFINMTARANCDKCLKGDMHINEQHDCYRIRNEEVVFERHHLIAYYNQSLYNARSMLDYSINDIRLLVVIQMIRDGHQMGTVVSICTNARVWETATNHETTTELFSTLWNTHPDNTKELEVCNRGTSPAALDDIAIHEYVEM